MAPVIEARSLTAVTLLAANPPQYPRNPAHAIQKPLVLYIARVPGSEDIFLTTLKPQQRVVTAHDVASSLYYFHVDSTHDEEIRELLGTEQDLRRDDEKEKENLRPRIGGRSPKRKPLPSTPRLALKGQSESAPKAYPYLQMSMRQGDPSRLVRKPIGGNDQDVGLNADDIPEVTPRKLWGPRPLHSHNPSVDAAISSTVAKEEIINEDLLIPRRFSEQPPVVASNLDVNSEPDTVASQTTGFSITMIRRDPGSGGQWNVGKITSGPIATRQNDNIHSPRHSQPEQEQSLFLEITNTGYNKYRSIERALLKPDKTSLDYTSTPIATQTHNLAASNSNEYHSFCRQLFLERPRSQPNGASPRGNEFRSSTDSTRSAKESTPTSPNISPQFSPFYHRPYSFLSPWNGTCEFSTGLAGRSLKCQHTLHSPASSPGSKDSSSAHTVSDLRFNLPSSKLLGLLFPRRPPLSTANHKRSSFFGNSHSRDSAARNHHEAEDSDDEDEERMDLSLGQEQAGGGLRGKQAKLGKLVVEDEGLKMLDLVVAANMGLWWSVCGNGFGKSWFDVGTSPSTVTYAAVVEISNIIGSLYAHLAGRSGPYGCGNASAETAIESYIAAQTIDRLAAMAADSSKSRRAGKVAEKRGKRWERDDWIGQVDRPDDEKLRENDRGTKRQFWWGSVA
ncbi:hypothetical protein MMC27_001965 [Xylographa pallens]|nr:hypothetical protein [Xylographa pallens]